MNIGINCCHLSDRIDGARTRIIQIYSSLIKMRKDDMFIFFVPKDYQKATGTNFTQKSSKTT